MKNSYYTLILTVISFLIVGCASIVSDTSQLLTFDSDPEGATVTISGKYIGVTPITMKINKGDMQPITFLKEGYQSYTTELSTRTDGWFWANFLLPGGFYFSTTDQSTGAMKEFTQDHYLVTLETNSPNLLSTSLPRKIKEFVIMFGEHIRQEVSANGGEKTDVLLNLLSKNESQKKSVIDVLYKFALMNSNNLQFAKKIISFYEIK